MSTDSPWIRWFGSVPFIGKEVDCGELGLGIVNRWKSQDREYYVQFAFSKFRARCGTPSFGAGYSTGIPSHKVVLPEFGDQGNQLVLEGCALLADASLKLTIGSETIEIDRTLLLRALNVFLPDPNLKSSI
jgi:hypothetical protein